VLRNCFSLFLMSLQHLLDAITAHANEEITKAENAAALRMSQKKEAQTKALSARMAEIDDQVEKRKTMLRAKAETHAKLSTRSGALSHKQGKIDEVFATVMEQASALTDKDVEPLLAALIKSLPNDGEIRPAKKHEALIKKLAGNRQVSASIDAKGGFLFVSKTQERNCTFEHLILTELRARKELDVARALVS
jgi:vacuolar-type H+-ATPase subunit E/Vma4